MDFVLNIFNGFSVGIERTVNKPIWIYIDDGYDIVFHSGVCITFMCFRIHIGHLYDLEEKE